MTHRCFVHLASHQRKNSFSVSLWSLVTWSELFLLRIFSTTARWLKLRCRYNPQTFCSTISDPFPDSKSTLPFHIRSVFLEITSGLRTIMFVFWAQNSRISLIIILMASRPSGTINKRFCLGAPRPRVLVQVWCWNWSGSLLWNLWMEVRLWPAFLSLVSTWLTLELSLFSSCII